MLRPEPRQESKKRLEKLRGDWGVLEADRQSGVYAGLGEGHLLGRVGEGFDKLL